MPRANRFFLPGYVWHITHRCHKQEFLLKFSRDRKNWIRWLFEAKKRYGLCVLNYIVTSNHVHLLVEDTKEGAIPNAMQLVAGRTAQEYNQRKQRKGAYWEDRYHATAVETDKHLFQCLAYIDLNMVRAGVVTHPKEWAHGGYQQIQSPPKRYAIVDLEALMRLGGFNDLENLQKAHRHWIQAELAKPSGEREALWTESIAVGGKKFVEAVQAQLGQGAKDRQCINAGDKYQLKEPLASYEPYFDTEMACLSK